MFPTILTSRIGFFRLSVDSMEEELRQNLNRCLAAFMAQRDIGVATVGRLAAGDWRFFDRLGEAGKTFTARKYDEVIDWFSENWPANAVWPEGVSRPKQKAPTS
ncbi:MAG: hypothetical protein Q8L13_11585 [Bradyrhizobium sp.]|nr:hypothetical protein [Bradyrhizobium sp.]